MQKIVDFIEAQEQPAQALSLIFSKGEALKCPVYKDTSKSEG